MLTKIKMFDFFLPKSRFFENFTGNRYSSKLLSNIKTKIEIIENFDQNRDFPIFFFTKIEIISENVDKNKILKKFGQNQDVF